MALQIGIVGLPNVGKSTLFNALTRSHGAQAANYPFCTIDPNVGIVEVPDKRLQKLAEIVHPEKILPAAVEFVDIAGLVKGASKGEGLGNKFLANIREVHAICHVVRLFPDGDVIHVDGSVDPKRDREVIEAELFLADLQTLQKQKDKLGPPARTGDKAKAAELALAERVIAAVEQGKSPLSLSYTPEEEIALRSWQMFSTKPIVYACNVSEKQMASVTVTEARAALGLGPESEVIIISAKVEEELQELSPEEGKEMLQSLGVSSSGLEELISAAYRALGYITYFTAGEKEVRAWTIRKGMTAPQAAGVIHTDFEKGFIRSETISFEDYVTLGGEQKAKEAGKLRVEGKDYVMKDGDVCHFRFNV